MANKLAAIHIGKKTLGMDDSTYRLLLKNMFGKSSAKELTDREQSQLLKRFNELGFTRHASHPGKPKNFAQHSAMITKVEALLADMSLPWSYADGIAKQQFGIEKITWIKDDLQMKAIIAALHVEQEKRWLLARVEALLASVGMSVETFEAFNQLPNNWKRNRTTLKKIINQIDIFK